MGPRATLILGILFFCLARGGSAVRSVVSCLIARRKNHETKELFFNRTRSGTSRVLFFYFLRAHPSFYTVSLGMHNIILLHSEQQRQCPVVSCHVHRLHCRHGVEAVAAATVVNGSSGPKAARPCIQTATNIDAATAETLELPVQGCIARTPRNPQ
jgi:hypothetical protein